MVQLVRGLLLESLVRGSNPLLDRLLLELLVRGWCPTCLAMVHMGLEHREEISENHPACKRQDTWDQTQKPDWLVTNLLPARYGRWWQDSSNYGKGWKCLGRGTCECGPTDASGCWGGTDPA
jgi:hypothetical protein